MSRLALIGLIAGSYLAPAAADSGKVSQIVHPFPAAGVVEIAGVSPATRVLRGVQRYSTPAVTDLLATQVAQSFQGVSGESVSVIRKPRQGGREAGAMVSESAGDGRILLLDGPGTSFPQPVNRRVGLKPVALVALMPIALVASRNHGYSTIAELIASAKRETPGALIGSAGEHSVAHRALELFRMKSGSSVEHVPYNGGAGALQAVATGQSSAAFVPLPSVLPYIGGGRVNVLAVAERRRFPALPNVPTMIEAGMPDFEIAGWFGLFAHEGTTATVIRQLNAMLAVGFHSKQSQEIFVTLGLRLDHRPAEAFAELLRQERDVLSWSGGFTRLNIPTSAMVPEPSNIAVTMRPTSKPLKPRSVR